MAIFSLAQALSRNSGSGSVRIIHTSQHRISSLNPVNPVPQEDDLTSSCDPRVLHEVKTSVEKWDLPKGPPAFLYRVPKGTGEFPMVIAGSLDGPMQNYSEKGEGQPILRISDDPCVRYLCLGYG